MPSINGARGDERDLHKVLLIRMRSENKVNGKELMPNTGDQVTLFTRSLM